MNRPSLNVAVGAICSLIVLGGLAGVSGAATWKNS